MSWSRFVVVADGDKSTQHPLKWNVWWRDYTSHCVIPAVWVIALRLCHICLGHFRVTIFKQGFKPNGHQNIPYNENIVSRILCTFPEVSLWKFTITLLSSCLLSTLSTPKYSCNLCHIATRYRVYIYYLDKEYHIQSNSISFRSK